MTSQEISLDYPWINKEFFEKSLRKIHPGNEIVVQDFLLKMALAKGENFTSHIIRANVNYTEGMENKEINFIIKTGLIIDEPDIYKREVTIYQTLMPLVEKLLLGIGDDTKFAAKCFDADIEQQYLVFEDLTSLGFKIIDKKYGLDLNLFQKICVKLAKWHAATAVLGTNDPSLMEPYQVPLLHEDSNIMKRVICNTIQLTEDISKKLPGYERIFRKLANAHNNIFQKACNSVKRSENDFNVLLHGDLWMSNIMFNHDENGDPIENVFVDYQLGYWGSPMLDIANIFFNSYNENITESDLDIVIQCYYDELKLNLIKLNYKNQIPTLSDIHTEFLKRAIFAVPGALLAIGMRYLEKAEETEDKFLGTSDEDRQFRLDMVSTPRCRKSVEFLLNFADKNGFYD